MPNKLGVIVPYRDRESHLIQFKESITNYLKNRDIPFEFIVVEQCDNKSFNRGKLLNIGFIKAESLGCNYVVFHDVDMLPIDVDYSYSKNVYHLATNFVSDSDYSKEVFQKYFGGVNLFPIESFRKINGYPNDYWGWGFEDDELFRRCISNGINTEKIEIKNRIQPTNGLKFNGKESYIKILNKINYNLPIKISVTFDVNKVMDASNPYDEWTIFSVPGYDLTLSYNSFGRYKFELWDYKKTVYSINSEIEDSTLTNVIIEIDPIDSIVTMQKDRETIGEFIFDKRLLDYSTEPYFYLGNSNPYRGNNDKEFYGVITNFQIWNNNYKLINLDFKNYRDGYILNKTDGEMIEVFGCENIELKYEKFRINHTPKRRNSLFKLLEHPTNGFTNGKWSIEETRLNQIKFNTNNSLSGLENIKYTIIKDTDNHLKVNI
jgi:hypothetical protein